MVTPERRSGSCTIDSFTASFWGIFQRTLRSRWKRAWGLPTRPTHWMPKAWRSYSATALCRKFWIPPSEWRDQRELLRLRIFLVRLRTRVKNRIHGTLARYNVQIPGADLFGVAARSQLEARLPELPEHSREAVEQELTTLDFLETQIEAAEKRVGKILSMVLMLETGRVDRFPTAAHLATRGSCRAYIPATVTRAWGRSGEM